MAMSKVQRSVMVVLMHNRVKTAVMVQKLFTDFGCTIRIRLGIHEGVLDQCTNTGMIILELVGDKTKHKELLRLLNAIPGVSSKLMRISL